MTDVGMNLAPVLYYSTEFPFIDRMKTASAWGAYGMTAPADAHGNPTGMPPGASIMAAMVALDPPSAAPTDIYELTWSGTAEFQFPLGRVISSEPGKIVFEFTGDANATMMNLVIRTISATDPVHDIHLVRQDEAAAFAQGKIFTSQFLEQVSNWQTLRFMDWGQTNNTGITSWDQRSHVDDATWAGPEGVPIEVMIRLANEARTDMWFNIPTHADDAYVRNALQLIKDQLAPGLKVHVEYSNEVWNLGFSQNAFAQATANQMWGTDANHDGVINGSDPAEAVYGGSQVYYGYRSAQIAAIANSVFSGADDSRLEMVLATQTGNDGLERYFLDGISRANVGSVSSLFDEISGASYFGYELGGATAADQAKIIGWAQSGQAGINAALNELMHGGEGLAGRGSIDELSQYVRYEVGFAAKYGLDFVGYEGGFHGSAIAYGANQALVQDFIQRLLSDPGMKTVYQYWLDSFEAAGGKMIAAFNDVQKPTIFGSFGTLDTLYDTKSPRYEALLAEAAPKQPLDAATASGPLSPASSASEPVTNVVNPFEGDIRTQYQTYGGREPTSAEYSTWSTAMQRGTTAAQIKEAILGSSLGKTYVDAQIDSAYQTFGGRSATASELSAWEGVLNGNGHKFDAVRDGILSSSLGRAHTAQTISQTYQTYAGRAPIGNEIANWQGAIRSGTSYDAMRQAILNDPLGQGHTRAMVTTIYQSLAGRNPTADEIAGANRQLLDGSDFSAVRATVLADAQVHAYEVNQITSTYQTYGGRSATDAEISAWHNVLVGGGSYGNVRDAILSSSLGTAYLDAQIDASYRTYGGRAANGSELSAWEGVLRSNSYTFSVVRDAILSTSLGKAYTEAQIDAAYHTYGGRAAQTNELRAWSGVLNGNNHDFSVVRDAILSTSLGKAYTDAQIDGAYHMYGGRAANAAELLAWGGVLKGNNHDFDVVRDAILSTSLGKAYTDAQIDAAYHTYGGRAANAAELSAWEGVLNGNKHDFSVVRTAIMSTSLGIDYANSQVNALYERYAQRDASSDEQATSRALLSKGADFDVLRDALMSSSASGATTQQLSGTVASDTFHLPTTLNNVAISGFDPTQDVIDLHGLGFANINPLDATHAREVHQLDGTTDVLISLDQSHDILLHGVTLAQLHPSDFLL